MRRRRTLLWLAVLTAALAITPIARAAPPSHEYDFDYPTGDGGGEQLDTSGGTDEGGAEPSASAAGESEAGPVERDSSPAPEEEVASERRERRERRDEGDATGRGGDRSAATPSTLPPIERTDAPTDVDEEDGGFPASLALISGLGLVGAAAGAWRLRRRE